MPSSPYQSPLRLRSSTASGTAGQHKKVAVTEFSGGVSLCVTVGADKKFGRAYYDQLWRAGGRGGRTPPGEEKNANREVCIFFFPSAHIYGYGLCLPPLSRL
jgi:hypothetical protein